MKKERLGFNLILMGMIASGKETQTKLLKKKYSLQPVETGVYSRNLLKEKSRDGDLARRTTGKGEPLPVVLIKKFIEGEIEKKPKNKDLIFIGGPRLKPEAQLTKKILDAKKQNLFVIFITLTDKEVYKRSNLRKKDKIKNVYKILDEVDIIKRRIRYHKVQVSKTVKYFESLGKLKKINGNQSIEKVYEDIEKALTHFKKLNIKKAK